MGSNPVGDASGGQRRQSSEGVMAEGEEPGRDAFEKMGKSLLFRGILKMPFFNNQQAEIQEFKKHKASWYF